MSTKKFFYLVALMVVATLNFSCEEQSTAETDELYGIDKNEIKDQDT